jgi:hypothetical protein
MSCGILCGLGRFFGNVHSHHIIQALTKLVFEFFHSKFQNATEWWWRSWLRYCATSRKVAGSIPDNVNGIYHLHNPSGITMALGLTQPLTEMSIRYISCGVKAVPCVGLTTLPPSCADCLEIWELQPSVTLRACPGL